MPEGAGGMSDALTCLVWEVILGWLDSEVTRVKDRGQYESAVAWLGECSLEKGTREGSCSLCSLY